MIFYLIAFAVFQIKSAGMKVKDFWTFIKANETLDKLYVFSLRYKKRRGLMINKRDMMDLIKALDSFNKLNEQISTLIGGSNIKNEKYNGLYKIYDVIKRNSKYNKEDDYDYDVFDSIIHSDKTSPEENYKLIML